ncbi:unnamed protein product [Candidula unifasciata]|uniref:THD domain-containing protein n=1 Tax=Candidula unifasciata TaxID=100452 RepID=A0A8S3ZX00_9EUPU|nr:unnamed protein product [Candidula unifasciata]
MPYSSDDATYWGPAQRYCGVCKCCSPYIITETSFSAMAKDTRVTFDSAPAPSPNKPANKVRHNRIAERQISYEDAENCVNEMSESFPALSTRAHRLMRQVSGSFNNRTIKVALIMSVILNLLLGIPFGIFFGFWMSQKNEAVVGTSLLSSSKDSNSYIIIESCFPCSDKDLDRNTRVKVKSKNNICCTDEKLFNFEGSPYFCLTADVFKRQCVGNTDIARAPQPCTTGSGNSQSAGGQSLAAAHLMLDVEQTKSRMKDSVHKNDINLVWLYRDVEHRTFVGDGVEYANGQITIHKAGKYHIYSHMTLSSNENPLPEHYDEIIIVHSLLWNPRGASKHLLFSQVTLKPNEVKSTDIEGSFELREGDVISVYLSHPSFLKNVSPANVFGLFILQQ